MRAVVLVIDSFGIGEATDAAVYGDEGANTAGHIVEFMEGQGGVRWPNLSAMGLGNALALATERPWPTLPPVDKPRAHVAALLPKSAGKDSVTGHWELVGTVREKPFHLFPQQAPSFSDEVLAPLREQFGLDLLGNEAASGTAIIARLGEQHMRTGMPIAYTSADSVFQIAAHEEVVPLTSLYWESDVSLPGPSLDTRGTLCVLKIAATSPSSRPGAIYSKRSNSLAQPAPSAWAKRATSSRMPA